MFSTESNLEKASICKGDCKGEKKRAIFK
jgi:hypothetical protein